MKRVLHDLEVKGAAERWGKEAYDVQGISDCECWNQSRK
jgi:hypothetical protein